MIRHIIPKGDLSAEHKRVVKGEIDKLDPAKSWLVQVAKYQKKRTLDQNAFLHAVPLRLICDHTGYEIDDIKTLLCGRAFGWHEYEVLGERRRKPCKTTSQLNTEQFNFFLEWLESWAAQELGLIIPKPNEHLIEEDTR